MCIYIYNIYSTLIRLVQPILYPSPFVFRRKAPAMPWVKAGRLIPHGQRTRPPFRWHQHPPTDFPAGIQVFLMGWNWWWVDGGKKLCHPFSGMWLLERLPKLWKWKCHQGTLCYNMGWEVMPWGKPCNKKMFIQPAIMPRRVQLPKMCIISNCTAIILLYPLVN